MTIPFFSVIICTFQRAHLIERALLSLQQQIEEDWEALIIDDGSTDGTDHIVQRYGEADPRIRYVTKDHEGSAAARNSGIKLARGLFVTFLDSDDEYEPDHLSSRRAMLLAYSMVQLLHGGVRVVGDEMVIDKDDPTKKIHVNDCIVGGTFVVRRTLFDRVGGFDVVPYAEDTLFYERCTRRGVVIARTDHPTYIYHRDSPDSLTNTYGQT